MNRILTGAVVFMLACCLTVCPALAGQADNPSGVNFKLEDLSGKIYRMSDYRGKQPVLLFFWTTWCPYCLTKLRMMNTEYLALEKDGVALLAVNAGERRANVERLVRNYAIKYTVLLDPAGQAAEDYGIIGVPTFVLIDSVGVIRYKGNDYPQPQIQQITGK